VVHLAVVVVVEVCEDEEEAEATEVVEEEEGEVDIHQETREAVMAVNRVETREAVVNRVAMEVSHRQETRMPILVATLNQRQLPAGTVPVMLHRKRNPLAVMEDNQEGMQVSHQRQQRQLQAATAANRAATVVNLVDNLVAMGVSHQHQRQLQALTVPVIVHRKRKPLAVMEDNRAAMEVSQLCQQRQFQTATVANRVATMVNPMEDTPLLNRRHQRHQLLVDINRKLVMELNKLAKEDTVKEDMDGRITRIRTVESLTKLYLLLCSIL